MTTNSYITECDKEPIHLSGRVQNRGFLLGFSKETFLINFVSENIEKFIPALKATECLGKDISDFLTGVATNNTDFKKYITNYRSVKLTDELKPRIVNISNGQYYLITNEVGNDVILEFEKVLFTGDLSERIASAVSAILNSNNAAVAFRSGLSAIQALTDFERIIVYRFLEDGSGAVIAEKCDADKDSWMGLHYPESDIPKQARALYSVNHMRLINDVHSPTYSILSHSEQPLDMTCLTLRAVAPIHIKYLKNMNDAASFSISLLNGTTLWGLVSCHSSISKNIDYRMRQAAKVISNIMMSRFLALQNEQDKMIQTKLDDASMDLRMELIHNVDTARALLHFTDDLLAVTNAQGFAILLGGRLYTKGITPPAETINEIIKWFKAKNRQIYYSDNFSAVCKAAETFVNTASGVLIALLQDGENLFIWFKPEKIYTIQWAGNPNSKKIIVGENITKFSPRESFEVWRETITNKSEPWSAHEIGNVEKIVGLVNESFNRKNVLRDDFEKALADARKDFEMFSYTVSHDLKTPLSVIKVYSQLLMLSNNIDEERQKEISKKIVQSVDVIDNMLKGIHHIMNISKRPILLGDVDVEKMVKEIIEQHTGSNKYPGAHIHVEALPKIKGDSQILYHAFSNVIGNAIKYSAKSENPHVSITGYETNTGIIYRIIDNGIGIAPENSVRVFELFKRLDDAADYEGTGVGLFIAKSVMERHNAKMWFISIPGEATAFYLIFNKR